MIGIFDSGVGGLTVCKEIFKRLPNCQIIYFGDTARLPYGTKEEVRRVTLERLEKCGTKGGIVIGPTHLVEPEVPWENLIAIIEAVNEFEGKYLKHK